MWMFSILPEPPAASRDLRISSVFYPDAKEVGAKPNLKALTYSYERAHSWRHIGAQILNASGWRPDCAQAQDTNIERILPPRPSEGAPLKSPRAGVLDMGDPKLCHLIDVLDLTEPTGVVVHASAFFQGGCGASCACIRMMDDPPETQRWIMGVNSVSSGPPEYVIEGTLLHALRIVDACCDRLRASQRTFTHVAARAGNERVHAAIVAWFRTGTVGLRSAAASEIAALIRKLKATLRCPIQLESLPAGFLEQGKATDQPPAGAILITATRLYSQILQRGQNKWKEQLARLPWRKTEVKAHLKRQYQEDDRRLIPILATEGSVACGIHVELGLIRPSIKEVLKSLDG